ncbi:glycerate kinase type-2 family protein [Novosphingobium terrae]|uniref:glycerate kinase type-2 family protein n=1 Tax=Novosphingobium terrae TaxID=2726189 RepID=UPI00197D0CDB|nr:glycerate kinase [Novosphingobium terrae]
MTQPAFTDTHARHVLRRMFDAAVESAAPAQAVIGHLPEKPRGRCVVVGAGKASAAMAAAVDTAWPDVDVSGVVVTRDGYAVPAGRIEILEAAHPVPDQRSVDAAGRILAAVQGLGADDLVLALVSGGGSALLAAPAPGMSLEDKQAVNRLLLHSGATIEEMNAVRKHLSAIKGGRLAAAAHPARVVSLLISDIPGDDPGSIASGPTVADGSTFADVQAILTRYAIDLPPAAKHVLERGEETPKPGSIAEDIRIIAAPALSLRHAAQVASQIGIRPVILGDAIEGEAREAGIVLSGIAQGVARHGFPASAPAVLLSGGETTVSIGKGPAGKGGRNTELQLSMALALKAAPNIWSIACDTDGIDGSDDAAGAIVTPDTLSRARARGLDPHAFLAGHDSYSFFEPLGDLVITGPTRTNVNDFRAILIG